MACVFSVHGEKKAPIVKTHKSFQMCRHGAFLPFSLHFLHGTPYIQYGKSVWLAQGSVSYAYPDKKLTVNGGRGYYINSNSRFNMSIWIIKMK